VRRTLGEDPLLKPLLRRRPGLRVPGAWDPFELAVRAVLGQQVSVAAARTLAARLVVAHGKPLPMPIHGLTHLFPDATVLATADLTGIGLTRTRALALNALAEAVADGRVVLEDAAAPDELRESLTRLPGIGPWTAEYVAMRALSEPDAFPAEDLVLRRMVSPGRPLTARALLVRAERWRPWRAYAVIHLWRAASDEPSQKLLRSA
jgi:AraC family transcriptional regulator of adaptative response / DNA-3-methyladenine glycosylase II